jgi:hypothetical protein
LKFAIGLFLVVVLAAAGSFFYVWLHRDAIVERVSRSLDKMVNGELDAGNVSIDFFHYFPRTAIHMRNVTLHDSLFHIHKMEFLQADDVFIKINFRDLFSSKIALERTSFHHGTLYVFKDSTGYSNNYLLKNKFSGNGNGIKTLLKEVDLSDFRVIYKDQVKGSFHNIYFNFLNCKIQEYEGKLALAIKSDGEIKMLAFKINKGSYARNASFNNNFIAYYDRRDNSLDIPPHTFYLNNQLVEANALLHFAPIHTFSVDLLSPRIFFHDALKLATL